MSRLYQELNLLFALSAVNYCKNLLPGKTHSWKKKTEGLQFL
jgi:hypothetical protein